MIKDVQPRHAGVYECQISAKGIFTHYVALNVLSKRCSSSLFLVNLARDLRYIYSYKHDSILNIPNINTKLNCILRDRCIIVLSRTNKFMFIVFFIIINIINTRRSFGKFTTSRAYKRPTFWCYDGDYVLKMYLNFLTETYLSGSLVLICVNVYNLDS